MHGSRLFGRVARQMVLQAALLLAVVGGAQAVVVGSGEQVRYRFRVDQPYSSVNIFLNYNEIQASSLTSLAYEFEGDGAFILGSENPIVQGRDGARFIFSRRPAIGPGLAVFDIGPQLGSFDFGTIEVALRGPGGTMISFDPIAGVLVPIPGGLALLGSALALGGGAGWLRRRRAAGSFPPTVAG